MAPPSPPHAGGDAQITVGASTTLHAGQTAPFDAAGVKAVRRGQPIPSGYALVGRKVTIDRGTSGSTGAVFSLDCPAGKTARTLGFTGQDGPELIGGRYVGHRSVRVAVWGSNWSSFWPPLVAYCSLAPTAIASSSVQAISSAELSDRGMSARSAHGVSPNFHGHIQPP